MPGIVIVDLGTGNLRSVSQAAAHVAGGDGGDGRGGRGAQVRISAEPEVIAAASHLILPGQGALGAWIDKLNANHELREAVLARLRDGPVLGICLGLQALYARSEEGDLPGLGLLAGTVKHFAAAHANRNANGDGDIHLRHPRLTMRGGDESGGGDGDGDGDGDARDSTVTAAQARLKIPHMGWNRVRQTREHPLWHGIDDGARFYFVHSYYVDAAARDEVAGDTDYGVTFTAAAARANLFATQFHPEKSQQAGLRLLHNFVNWNGE